MDESPLRILSLADMAPNPNSGAGGSEVRTFEFMRELGHEIDAIWRDDLPHRIGHDNLHILFELPKAFERATAEALSRKTYDVIHANQPHGYLAARLVRRISPETLFVHRSHGFELNAELTLAKWRRKFPVDDRSVARRAASSLLAPLLARHSVLIAKEADAHNVLCGLDAEFLEQYFGIDRERIVVVATAPPEAFRRAPAPPMTPERLKRVLHVSQFAFFKAPMVTAEAMNRLGAARPDLHFVWVCDRKHHDDVRALLSEDVRRRLDLHHWRNQEELQEIYDGCGVFLFPSFFEGFGKVFLEAMCRGMCVVATDAGGMHDVIHDGVDGRFVPAGDAVALAQEALRIIEDPVAAAAMSVAAARRAREYSWERAAHETVDFYRRRLSEHRSGNRR